MNTAKGALCLAPPNNTALGGVRLSTIEALCEYFGVGVGELIEYRKG